MIARILDDLTNVFLDTSSAGWSNKHENGIIATESRGDESKRNCFQICADGHVRNYIFTIVFNYIKYTVSFIDDLYYFPQSG